MLFHLGLGLFFFLLEIKEEKKSTSHSPPPPSAVPEFPGTLTDFLNQHCNWHVPRAAFVYIYYYKTCAELGHWYIQFFGYIFGIYFCIYKIWITNCKEHRACGIQFMPICVAGMLTSILIELHPTFPSSGTL